MAVATRPFRRRSFRQRMPSEPAEAFAADRRRSQISDSGTSRRIQKTTSAGSTPTKNTARQPRRGSTSATTPAAIISPMAHVDCIRPSALARCSGGQVSAMSAAPVVHSPPMPSPRMNRQIASWTIVWERPQAPLATE